MSDSTQYSSQVTSTLNSSTTIVPLNQFFEGQWELVDTYSDLSIVVLTNQAGLIYAEFSNDGVELLEVKTFAVVASVEKTAEVDISSYKYFRARFRNTGGTQSSFSLVSTYFTGGTYDAKITESALPTGAATAALQVEGNDSSKQIDTKLADIKTKLDVINAYLDSINVTQVDGSQLSGVVGINSTTNNSTTPLAGGATFTGTGELNHLSDAMVSCQTDATGTLYFDFSVNGTDWTTFPTAGFGVAAGIHEFHTAVKGGRYFRVRLVNGGSAQSYLRLYTYYGQFRHGNAPLNQSIGDDSDAIIVRSISVGESPNGQYTNDKTDGSAFVTTTPLNDGAEYDSGFISSIGFTQIQTQVTSSHNGQIQFIFATDSAGTDVVRTITLPYIAANGYQLYSAPVFSDYIKYKFLNNSGSNQTDFYYETKFYTKSVSGQLLRLDAPMSGAMITTLNRSILVGSTDGGQYKNVPITPEGHLEVAIHGPRLPFGSVHTENLTPVIQTDGVYGLNSGQVSTGVTGSGSIQSIDSVFTCSTGATIYSSAYLQSRKRLRYRAGQGIVGRFTAAFTSGVTNSYQVVGFGHAEDGIYVGYKDGNFGILYSHHGVREIQTLTITNAATGAGNVTVTLAGTAYTVAVSASAVGNIARTAYEISLGVYSGWLAQANGGGTTVVYIASSTGNKTGTFSVSGSGVVGTFAETLAGSANTEQFINQADFNGDVLDGTGASGFNIDPSKLNVFQLGIQYLGAGTITVEVETTPDSNNSEFTIVHSLKLPNTLSTKTSFSNPSFPFTMSAYSAGSTTDLTMRVGSFAGFVEGKKQLNGNRFSYFNALTTANATNYTCLFTIKNSLVHSGRANQSVVNILSMNGAVKHTQPVVFYLIRNATLLGNPSFSDYASDISATIFDNSATTCTFTSNSQLVWTGHLGETGEIDHEFAEGGPEELTLQPGESLTLAVKSVQNNVAWVTGSINTREDQ